MAQNPLSHDDLYEIQIEVLELSEVAITALHRYGVMTIGDVIDHYKRGADAMITVLPPFISVMNGEVMDKIKHMVTGHMSPKTIQKND